MLEISGLHANYGGIRALGGVELSVEEGEIVALLGSNGAGKSTLLGCVTASAECQIEGSITFDKSELIGKSTDVIIRAGVVLVPEGRQLFADLTVYENLMMGAYLRRGQAELKEDLDVVLDMFPVLGERAGQLAKTLSGGEQQMVAIGRALMARPRLLLLDEPSLGLAPKLVQEIFNFIPEINRRGVAVLLVEQNARQALKVSHRAYVLEKGEITMSGESASLADDPHVVAVYLGGG